MSTLYEKFWLHNNLHHGLTGHMDDFTRHYEARRFGTRNFSWAIPCESALRTIAELSPIVEIGAGGGYWAQQLRKRGANVTPFDRYGSCTKRNHYVSRRHIHVHRGGPKTLRKARFRNHTLLLVWPPCDSDMALQCLQNFRGNNLCYVGEGHGGCTGCDKFHDLLYTDFDETNCIDIPQWDGLYDRLYIFQRRP